MNTPTTFFRLLHVPIETKGDALAERIAALNATGVAGETYTLDPVAFAQIPGSPFAYWVGDGVLTAFAKFDPTETGNRVVRVSNETGDDFRFMRLWTEVPPEAIGTKNLWVPHAKGGAYSPYFHDLHLLVAWDDDRSTIRGYHGRPARPDERMASTDFFFRPGLTYPRRTDRFSARVMPADVVFSNKGVGIFVEKDNDIELLFTVAIMNSYLYNVLIRLQSGRDKLAQSFEVGVVQKLPLPQPTPIIRDGLAQLALEAHNLQRDRDRTDEKTHAFCLPGLATHRDAPTLLEASAALNAEEAARQSRLAVIQSQIDNIVFDLYGLSEADRGLVRQETGGMKLEAGEEDIQDEVGEGDEDEEIVDQQSSIVNRVQDLLMWCVGAAFGRWDVRIALDLSLLPSLGGPFDPLPRYAPGALIDDPAGIQSPIEHYKLQIPSDGILVDDSTHPSDIMRRVREVLELLWGDQADAIENEACEILGVKTLREYFRDSRRFFAYHIKRYSKSRRKAPIYWLLQSERRSYGIWLYYHRITPMTLYIAGRDYADSKIALERGRLDDLRAGLDALSGTARRSREREIERQEKLVAEVTAFGKTLDKLALANLPPDPNDGVLISIAPLHPLVPWSEAARMWEALRSGQYSWSTMAKKMAEGSGQQAVGGGQKAVE